MTTDVLSRRSTVRMHQINFINLVSFILERITMFTYDKPFLDKRAMFKKLRYEKNLIINNEDFADEVIRKLSYYDLVNGSKEVFIDKCPDGKEIFKPNTTIEDLYNFYIINDEFQNIIVRRLFMVETLFKNELAYILAREFGVDTKDYLDKMKYRKSIKTKRQKIKVADILDKIYKNIRKMGYPTKHYLAKHNHIPPWILLKNVEFHAAIQLYEALNNTEKDYVSGRLISSSVKDKAGIIKNMLTISRLYRNEIVHNYKFLTYKDHVNVSVTGISTIVPSEMLVPKSNGKDVYTVILCILILLDSDRLRLSFINDIVTFTEQANLYNESLKSIYATYFDLLDLPNDFVNKIHWYRNYLVNKNASTDETIIQANRNSKIYHLPGGKYYGKIHKDNILIFKSETEAIEAGYRKSKR